MDADQQTEQPTEQPTDTTSDADQDLSFAQQQSQQDPTIHTSFGR